MRRFSFATLIAMLWLGGMRTEAQSSGFILEGDSPSSAQAGSGDTLLTLTGRLAGLGSGGYGVCFYAGVTNTPLAVAVANASSVSVTVPADDFNVVTTASIYIETAGAQCTGRSPGLSNTLSFSIGAATQQYTITGANPGSVPAGSGDTLILIAGTAATAEQLNYGVCFYTGFNTSTIIPSSFTPSDATFTVPAANFAMNPALFTDGSYNALIYLGPFDAPCTGTSIGVSNTFTVPIVYPALTGLSQQALPQANPSFPSSSPSKIELYGYNFTASPNTLVEFNFQGSAGVQEVPAGLVLPYDAVAAIPAAPQSGLTPVLVSACNANGTFRYCSGTISVPAFPLAAATTQLTASSLTPAMGASVVLSGAATPGAGSTTAGGPYAPGVPGGAMTFLDNGTVIGSAPLIGASESFTQVGLQVINSGSVPSRVGPALAARGPQARPRETPVPVTGTGFTSLVADFNQDGVPDSLVVEPGALTMHLFLGASPLGNQQPDSELFASSGCSTMLGAAAGDVNEDGYPDIVYLCTNYSGGTSLQVFLNQGDGSFAASTPVLGIDGLAVAVSGDEVGIGDLNCDGNLDIVVLDSSAHRIQTFLAATGGGFTVGPVTSLPADTLSQLVVKDLDYDGAADVVMLDYSPASGTTVAQTYINDATGNFTAFSTVPICNCVTSTSKLFVTPLTTNSQYPDIAVAYTGTAPAIISALNKNAAGVGFGTAKVVSLPSLADAVLGDFNGDGYADLAYYDGQKVYEMNGDGLGNFNANPSFQALSPTTGTGTAFAFANPADLNGDGAADLITIAPAYQTSTPAVITYLASGNSLAVLPTRFATSGTHAITTSYTGTPNLLGGAGGSTTIIVPAAKITPVVAVSISPPPHVYTVNLATLFTITITGTTVLPTGTVQFYANGRPQGPAAGVTQISSNAISSTITYASLPAGTFTFYAVYSGDSVYNSVTSETLTYTVSQATPTISWTPNPATITYGTPLSTGQLDATANVPGSFVYSPGETSILDAGTQTLSTTFTPNSTDYKPVTTTATITVTQAAPVVTWGTSTIAYGTALSSVQLNATARDRSGNPLPGVYTYNPAAGTVLPVGTTVGTVSFAPTSSRDFTSQTATANLVVVAADTTTVLAASPSSPVVGSAVGLTATVAPTTTGTVAGTVAFYADNVLIGRATLSGGSATFSYTPLTAGAHSLTATFAGSTNYNTSSGTTQVTATSAVPTLTWNPNPSTIPLGTPLSAGQLDAMVSGPAAIPNVPGRFSYTPALGAVLVPGQQTLHVTFTPNDLVNFQAVSGQATITVAKGVPTASWSPAPLVIGSALGAAQLNAVFLDITGNPLAGTATYTPPAGTIVTAAGAYPLSVTFTPTDAADYETATATAVVEVTTKTTATLTSSMNPSLYGVQVALTATVGYGPNMTAVPDGTVTFFEGESNLGSAPVTRGKATFTSTALAVGTHNITAVYSGDTAYASSTSLPYAQVIYVRQATIVWNPAPATIVYGTPLGSGQLDATGIDPFGNAVAGTFAYSPAAGTVPQAGTQTLSTTFTPASLYAPVSAQRTITVTKATPAITWVPAAIAVGTVLGAGQLNAVAHDINGNALAGTYTYSPPAGTVLGAGTQTLNLTFVPTDSVDYASVQTTAMLTVNKLATSSVLTSSLNPAFAGQTVVLSLAVTPASSSSLPLSGTVTFFDNRQMIGTGAVTNGRASFSTSTLGTGTHPITANYAGDGNYLASSASSLSQVIKSRTPTLTWTPNPANIVYGTPLGTGELDAVATDGLGNAVSGTYVYAPASGAVLTAGTQSLSVTFTPLSGSAFQAVTGQTSIVVGQATPVISWTPAPLTAGVGLGAAQLNAVAKDANGVQIPGAYTYSPAAGATLPIGAQRLSVSFAPTDAVDYKGAVATALVSVVSSITTTMVGSSVNPGVYGQPIVLTATITRSGSGSSAPTGTVTFLDGTAMLGQATLAGGAGSLTVSSLTAGAHTIVAQYSGDSTDAGNISAGFVETVNQSVPQFTWVPSPASIVYGTALAPPGATPTELDAVAKNASGAVIPGTFTYAPAAGSVLQAGTRTLTATFIPTDGANVAGGTVTATLAVTRATPTIAWAAPAAIAQGTALSATQLNAVAKGVDGAALAGSYLYAPAAGTVLLGGTTHLQVTFTPADAVDYQQATATVPITVALPSTATSLVTSANPGQPGQTIVLTATVAQTSGTSGQVLSGPVTFFDGSRSLGMANLAGGNATLSTSSLTVGPHSLSAVYGGSASFQGSTSNVLIETIAPATTVVSWSPSPSTIVYGTGLSAAQLDATASTAGGVSVAGTLTYTPAAGTLLGGGTHTLSVSFMPTDGVNFAAATGSASITVSRATPTLTWTTPAAVVQGTALSATQLNAVAAGISPVPLAGSYTYTPAAGTVLPSGPNVLTVLFTPTDLTDYTTATATVPLTVSIPAASTTLASSVNPTQYGQATILTGTVLQGGTGTPAPTGSVSFFDGTHLLGTAVLNGAGTGTLSVSSLGVGTHPITVAYSGDASNAAGSSTALTQTVVRAPSVVTFTPNPATIVFGTPLSPAQLDGSATSLYVASVPGSFVYTPALGTVPGAGQLTLNAAFTPADAVNFAPATQTASLTVTKATPVLSFPTPPAAVVGSTLSAAQLNASATGVGGATLAGTYVYTPAAGTLVGAGPQVLTVLFTPIDSVDYTTATASVTLNGTAVTLTKLSQNTGLLGAPDTTITLTGTGFVTDSTARVNGVAVATSFVNGTTLTAVLPASSFLVAQTLQISVSDPTQKQTTAALPFTVTAPPVTATVIAPSTANPGEQPTIQFKLNNPYPVDVVGTFTLSFTPGTGGVDDPAIQFTTGMRSFRFTVPAGKTTVPDVQIQSGTVAGTIQITLTLAAGGVDVTPAGLLPVIITVPPVVPGITSVTIVRSGRTLTVNTYGFSNTRAVSTAQFHFVPAAGQQIQTQDLTVDAGTLFSGWYGQTVSDAYGSTFLYTQTFTLDEDATVVGQVMVTLSNGIGTSMSGSSE